MFVETELTTEGVLSRRSVLCYLRLRSYTLLSGLLCVVGSTLNGSAFQLFRFILVKCQAAKDLKLSFTTCVRWLAFTTESPRNVSTTCGCGLHPMDTVKLYNVLYITVLLLVWWTLTWCYECNWICSSVPDSRLNWPMTEWQLLRSIVTSAGECKLKPALVLF